MCQAQQFLTISRIVREQLAVYMMLIYMKRVEQIRRGLFRLLLAIKCTSECNKDEN